MRNIPLVNGGHAIVDDTDFLFLSQFDWRWKDSDGSGNRHVVRNTRIGPKKVTIRMHRLITEADPDDRVLFANQNGLDCRRRNLIKRRLTPWTGRPLSSGYRGVVQLSTNHYRAEITYSGRTHVIGVEFPDGISAAMAYDEVARKLYGKQARTNFNG